MIWSKRSDITNAYWSAESSPATFPCISNSTTSCNHSSIHKVATTLMHVQIQYNTKQGMAQRWIWNKILEYNRKLIEEVKKCVLYISHSVLHYIELKNNININDANIIIMTVKHKLLEDIPYYSFDNN